MLEALVAALPHLLLSADETPDSQQSSSIGQLVAMVLGACSTVGLTGMLCVLRLPALLAPHMEALLARKQVSPHHTMPTIVWKIQCCVIFAEPDLNPDSSR